MEKHYPTDQTSVSFPEMEDQKPDIKMALPPKQPHPQPSMISDLLHMDTSESVPRLQTDSSSSEHVLSPEMTVDKEVQSEPKWNNILENGFNDFELNYMDNLNSFQMQDDPFAPQVEYQMEQLSPLQDIFMILQQKPF